MVESRLTGTADNRLICYRKNQKEIPLICNGIVPETIRTIGDYQELQNEIFAKLRARGGDILCEEWVNSSGLVIRFTRKCLEIKALDEQECIHADMAVCAFVRSLLRYPSLPVETDRDALLALTETAIQRGTAGLIPELEQLYAAAWDHATHEELRYLPVIRDRIEQGSLAELICDRYRNDHDIIPTLADLAACLKTNQPYTVR
jgi:hypothetical protein